MSPFREYFRRASAGSCIGAAPGRRLVPRALSFPSRRVEATCDGDADPARTEESLGAGGVSRLSPGGRRRASSPFEVRIVLRAQRGDFQNEEEASLFDRVSHLAEPARAAGFVEVERNIAPVIDPGDASRTLDTFYEITLSKEADSLERAVEGLHFAMTLEKMATAKPA